MAKWYEAVNQASFRPADGGYVFRSPNPWIFGWPRYYLVNEAQKAQIIPYLGRWRLLLMLAVLAEAVILGSFIAFVKLAPAMFLRLAAPAFHFGTGVFAVSMFILLMLLLAPLIVMPQLYLNRRLDPVLATATRTSQKIATGDQLARIATAVSGKVLAIGLVSGIFMMGAAAADLIDAYSEGRRLSRLLWPSMPIFALGAAATAYFVYLVRLRTKQGRDTAANGAT